MSHILALAVPADATRGSERQVRSFVRRGQPDEKGAATANEKSEVFDYAIVGAGVAGAYVAWRIARAKASLPPRIRVFEALSKEGGRLVTAKMPGMPFLAEIGGMRYIEGHIILASLAKELNLASESFKFDQKRLFLRGQLVKGPNPDAYYGLKDGTSPVAYLKRALSTALYEMDFGRASRVVARSIRKKIARIATKGGLRYSLLTPDEWDEVKRHAWLKEQPLYKSGFWNLLHHYFESWEEFSFVRDALGYHSIFENWNAAEAIPWFLKDFDAEYLRLRGGMDRLPASLVYRVKRRLDVDGRQAFEFKRKVRSISAIWVTAEGAPLFELAFCDGGETARARKIVLAVPKAALQEITFVGFDPQQVDKFMDRLNAVKGHPLFKLFLGYKNAWWGDLGDNETSGRAVTDLPLRQVYYLGAGNSWDPKTSSADPTTKMGMLMAGYSDAVYVDFWRPVHRQHVTGEEEEQYFCKVTHLDADARVVLRAFGATHRMVLKAQRLLEVMHPDLKVPKPIVALEREWEAGWHSWQPHYRSWDIMSFLKRPFGPGVDVFICGEAYSGEQGWIEGALRSAELVLSELGFQRPDWLETTGSDGVAYDFGKYIGAS